ncbi:MAG TPA: hypothetical protein VHB78_11220 [Vicinamibacterales bacterium]|jgi:hypothetical protein|nr:hypothetical protein [Vicinamibacterales bacterium]
MMNDRPDTQQPSGLCATCRHARVVMSDRGSRFVQCGRARTEPAYPKYPRLPVLTCPGHESVEVG